MKKHFEFKRTKLNFLVCIVMLVLLMSSLVTHIAFAETANVDGQKVTLGIKATPKIDIALAKARTLTDVSGFEGKIKEKLSSLGVDISDTKVQALEAEKVELSEQLNWSDDKDDTVGNITITDQGKNVKMVGNQTKAGKNAIYIIPPENKEQKFTFGYKIEFGDSFNAAGMLLRVKDSNGYLTGYMLSFNQSGHDFYNKAQSKPGALWKFKWKKNDNLNNMANSSNTLELKQALDIDTTGQLTVSATDEEIKISGGNLAQEVDYKIPENEASDLGNGYGFFSDHYSHSCTRWGEFSLTDINLQETTVRKVTEVLREPTWRTNSYKFFVFVTDETVKELEDRNTGLELLTRIINENTYFVPWGTSTNKSKMQEIIANCGQGKFIDNNSHNYDEAIRNTAEYIKSIFESEKSTTLLLNEPMELSVTPESIKTGTATGDGQWKNGKWKVTHDENFFENGLGQFARSGQYTSDMITKFDKPGKYTLTYEDKTVEPDNILVHRRPTAIMNLSINGTAVTTSSESYDLDKMSESRGIETTEWRYKTTDATEWTSGQLSTIQTNKDYIIQLKVKDKQGTWSYPVTKYITSDTSALPVAMFNLVSDRISKYEKMEINDSSYDPVSGRSVQSYNWELYKVDNLSNAVYTKQVNSEQMKQQVADNTYTFSDLDFTSSDKGAGEYMLYLTVTNNASKTSEKFGRMIEVTEDIDAPEVVAKPMECEWQKSQTVSLDFTDRGGSNFKEYQYLISDTQEPAQNGWSAAIQSEHGSVTITQEGQKYLQIKGRDNANNESTRVVGPYKIDNTEPTVQISADFNTHTTEPIDISIQSTDPLSGVKEVRFNGQKLDGKEQALATVDTNGTYSLEVEDNVGNIHREQITVSNIYQNCMAGLEHPDFPSDVSACPICEAIKGLEVTKDSQIYNAQGQRIKYSNPQNSAIIEYYNGLTNLPEKAGLYSYELKVNYNGTEYKTGKTGIFTIEQKKLTIENIAVQSRKYDGTQTVNLSGGNLVGVEEKDIQKVGFELPKTGIATSKNVGTRGVKVNEIILNGERSNNYQLIQPTEEELQVEITQKDITIEGIEAKNRQYNGTKNIEIENGELVGIESVDVGRVDFTLPQLGTIENKNVGEYGVTIPEITLKGEEAGNYNLIQPTNEEVRVEVTPKDINIENIQAEDREYDSTKVVKIKGGNLVGVEEIDNGKVDFILPETGTIPQKDVGMYYVIVPQITLSGEEASNYNLIQPGGNEIHVNITKKTVQKGTNGEILGEVKVENIIPQDREYDGTTAVELQGGELVGIEEIDKDKVGFVLPETGMIENKNIGTYNVTIPEIILTGEEAKNYQLTQPKADEFNVTISKRKISLEYVKGKDRLYDKTKIVDIIYGKLLNVVEDEDVKAVVPEQGISENEHVGKWQVEINEITIAGEDVENYELIPTDPTDITVNILKPMQPKLHIESFVSKINDKQVNETIPLVSTTNEEENNIKVNYKKTKLSKYIRYNDKFEITIRIYNEGKGAGYAQKIINEIPNSVEFLEDDETNNKNGWKKIDNKKYETEILNFDSGIENEINEVTKDNVDYREVKIALLVTDAKFLKKEVKNITFINAVDIENVKATKDDITPSKKLPIIQSAIAEAGWKNHDKTITINSVDQDNNGIAGYAITTENEEPTEWEESNETTWTSSQTYDNGTYYAWVKDLAGNISESKEVVVDKIDKVKPTVENFSKDMLNLKGIAKDEESGICEYQFSKDSEINESSEGWKTIFNPKAGEITKVETVSEAGEYYFYIKDQAGNMNKSDSSITITQDEIDAQAEKKINVTFKYYDNEKKEEQTKEVEGIVLAGKNTVILNSPEIESASVDIFGKTVTAKPRGWAKQETSNAPIEVENGASIEVSKSEENLTYYMSYEYAIKYGVNTKDVQTNRAKREEKQMKINVNSKGETTANEQRLDLPQIATVNNWEYRGWTKGSTRANGEIINIETEKPDPTSITEYHASYKKEITIDRYVYKNQKIEPTINKTVFQNDFEKIKPTVKLGTISSISISENAQGESLGKTETAEPRGWSTSPNIDAQIEVPSSNEREIEIEENATYYASYSYGNKYIFIGPDGNRVEENGGVNVDYLGNTKANETSETKFPELPVAPDGWSAKGWVKGGDPTLDAENQKGIPEPNIEYYATYKKTITLDRYVYRSKRLEQMKGSAYKNCLKEVPAEFNLGTTENVQIKTKSNGEALQKTIEATPRVWATSTACNAEDTSANNSDDTRNEETVALNGKAHLLKNETYYMSYTYNLEVLYNDGDEDKQENRNISLGYNNETLGNVFDLQDPQVPGDWGNGWSFNGWFIGEQAINQDNPSKPEKFEPETKYNAGFRKEIAISFNANSGNPPVPETISQYKYKTANKETTVSIKIPSNNLPSKEKHELIGFDENSGASEATYKVGETYEFEDSKTLYAIWKELDEEGPSISFNPDGNEVWSNSQSTTVTVTDDKELSEDSTKYTWSVDPYQPDENEFNKDLHSGELVTLNEVTGKYYLWVKAIDTSNNKTIKSSRAFYIDNENPEISGLSTGGISEEGGIELVGTAQDTDSGIVAYQFSKDGNITNETLTGWEEVPAGTTTEISKKTTINSTGTWYFYVKDGAGNYSKTQIDVNESDFEVLKPTIQVSPKEGWTKEVAVTIYYPEVNGLEKIYTKGSGEERYTEQFTIIDNNTTITAKSKLGDIEIEADPVTISNIDREGPEELIIDGNTENASVTFRAKDSKSGVDKIKIEYEGKTLVATYTYKTGWFSSGVIMYGYAYQGVSGLWGKGPIKFYAIDKLGNTSETTDEDWNAVDSSPPVIEFVSAVPEGTANCPYCDEHPASGKIRLTFNLVSEEGTGLYDYSGTPYISIIKENTEDEINGHFKYITMPEKGATTGQFVAEMYIHGATSADYSGHINNLTVLDMYGNQSNPIQFEYKFGS